MDRHLNAPHVQVRRKSLLPVHSAPVGRLEIGKNVNGGGTRGSRPCRLLHGQGQRGGGIGRLRPAVDALKLPVHQVMGGHGLPEQGGGGRIRPDEVHQVPPFQIRHDLSGKDTRLGNAGFLAVRRGHGSGTVHHQNDGAAALLLHAPPGHVGKQERRRQTSRRQCPDSQKQPVLGPSQAHMALHRPAQENQGAEFPFPGPAAGKKMHQQRNGRRGHQPEQGVGEKQVHGERKSGEEKISLPVGRKGRSTAPWWLRT